MQYALCHNKRTFDWFDFQNLKQTSCVGMIALWLLGYSTHPWEPLGKTTPTVKLHGRHGPRRKCAKSSVTRSAADYSISLKFSTEFKRIIPEVLERFKVKRSGQRSQHDIAYLHANKRYNSWHAFCHVPNKRIRWWWISYRRSKLGKKNISEPSATSFHRVQSH